jgi:hypothetical protein
VLPAIPVGSGPSGLCQTARMPTADTSKLLELARSWGGRESAFLEDPHVRVDIGSGQVTVVLEGEADGQKVVGIGKATSAKLLDAETDNELGPIVWLDTSQMEFVLDSIHRAGVGPQGQFGVGLTSEALVKRQLESLGLSVAKPFPDVGIDLEATLIGTASPKVTIQVKARGATQTNKKYRWFQIRASKALRERTVAAGRDVSTAWESKVRQCDFFVLVSLKHNEYWVLPQAQVLELGEANRLVHGKRPDNRSGKQAELDLDIEPHGEPLTRAYEPYLNAFQLVKEELERRL